MNVKIVNAWDLIANQYDAQFGDEGDYSHKYIIYPALLEILDNIQNKKVLDLGCGTGTLTRIISKRNAKATGTDNSKEMIAIADKKKDTYKFPIEYYVADARNKFKFENNYFDIVLHVMLLHSIADNNLDNIFKESFRVLEGNGECIIVIPHPFFTKEFKSVDYPAGDLYLSNYETHFVWKQFNEICKSPTEFYLRPLEFYSQKFNKAGFVMKNIYEPKIVDTNEAINAKPNIFNRRREIPGFMIIKLVKSNL